MAGFGCGLAMPGRQAPDTAGVGIAGGGETERPVWLAGNVGGAWRIGGTVHRTTGPWTPAVHALLDFLAPCLEHTPRVLGFDEQGREVLTFLPGLVVDNDTEPLTPGQIDSLVRWTRRFHQVVAGFGHPALEIPARAAGVPDRPQRHRPVQRLLRRRRCGRGVRLGSRRADDAADGAGLHRVELCPAVAGIGDRVAAERIGRICSAYGGVHPAQKCGRSRPAPSARPWSCRQRVQGDS